MSLFVDLLVHELTQLYSMVGCIWQELVELLLYARSKEWMTVQGIACVVYTDKERKRLDLVEVMIVYMYRFQGKPYTGSITRTPVAHPNRMIGRFPHKAPVMVHVNPSYPEASYVSSGEPWYESLLVWIPATALFVAVCLGALVSVGWLHPGVVGAGRFAAIVLVALLFSLRIAKYTDDHPH